jgi:hypothetical protein
MTLTLIIVAAIGVISFVERSFEHLKLAIAAHCFSWRCCCSPLPFGGKVGTGIIRESSWIIKKTLLKVA